jgi:type IV pilus assembly protein PilC
MEAPALADVERRLESQGLTIVKLKKKPKDLVLKIPGSTGVALKDLVVFTRQLATMIDAGLPIVQALDLLGGQEPNPNFKVVLKDIKMQVETGSTFADSLRKHPKIFDSLYTNLVAAGEVGGVLDSILNRLAVYIEKNAKLKRKVKGAMVYPMATLVIACLVVAVLLWKVIPTFEEMFSSFGDGGLPGPTQFVIDLSHAFVANLLPIFGAAVAIPILVAYLLRQRPIRRVFDKVLLHTPVFGPVLRKTAVARFTRTLGTMVTSGVAILDALEIVAKSAGNIVVEEAVLYTRSKISEGTTLADPLMETNVFPEMVVQMISVGEATGALDVMLNKIADFYDEEVEVAVEGLTQLLEPLMMVVIGGVVGGMLIAMYLPIFSLADTIKGK